MEQEEFNRLLEKHYPTLVKAATLVARRYNLNLSHDEGKELLHDVVVKQLKKAGKLDTSTWVDTDKAFKGYIYSQLVYEMRLYWREKRDTISYDTLVGTEFEPSIDEPNHALNLDVNTAFQKLSKRLQWVTVWMVGGYTEEEVAEKLNISRQRAGQLWNESKSLLSKDLEEYRN